MRSEPQKISDSNKFEDGSDSIGDILFICLGAFILLFMIANFETSALQEKQLPDLNLSKFEKMVAGKKHDASLTLSVKNTPNGPVCFLDNKKIKIDSLEDELRKLGGIAKLALRREKINTALEDKIIVAATNSGISKLSIVVQNSKNNQ